MPVPKKKRPPFLDSRVNNRADTLIRDFDGGNRALNHPSVRADVRELIFYRAGIKRINERGKNRTLEDREKVKQLESHMRTIFRDIAAKRAKLKGQDVYSKSPTYR